MWWVTFSWLTQAVGNHQVLSLLVLQVIVETTVHRHGHLVEGHKPVKVLRAIPGLIAVEAQVQVPLW